MRVEEDADEKRKRTATGTSPLEWVVAGLGGLLVAGLVALLVYQALIQVEGPPVIRMAVAGIEPAGEGWHVEVTVTNDGHSTASALDLAARLKTDGQTVEEATATLDYLPQNATRHAGFYFGTDPAGHDLELVPLGYADP